MELWPPGGCRTRLVARSEMKFPQFWFWPFACDVGSSTRELEDSRGDAPSTRVEEALTRDALRG